MGVLCCKPRLAFRMLSLHLPTNERFFSSLRVNHPKICRTIVVPVTQSDAARPPTDALTAKEAPHQMVWGLSCQLVVIQRC